MGYLVSQMIVYLIAAAVIGFVTAWVVRGKINRRERPVAMDYRPGERQSEDTAEKGEEPTRTSLEGKILYLERRPPNADDLKRIRGIGPTLERTLNQAGVFRFEQLAQLDQSDVDAIADRLRTFPARIIRDRWVEQARELARR